MRRVVLSLVLLILTLTACDVHPLFNTKLEKINQVSSTITQFDLPGGFMPEISINLDNYVMVSYKSGNIGTHLYIIQANNATETEILLSEVENYISNITQVGNPQALIESRPVVVRGKETTLVINEGLNGNGKLYRQAMVAFNGIGGPALLIFSSPTEVWNMETINTLIESLR